MKSIKMLLATGITFAATAAALALVPTSAAVAAAQTGAQYGQCDSEYTYEQMEIPAIDNYYISCRLAEYSGSTHKTAVRVLQSAMNICFGSRVLGKYYPLSEDGDFGDNTQAALKLVQHDIGVSADGQYGPDTCRHMHWVNDSTVTPCLSLGG